MALLGLAVASHRIALLAVRVGMNQQQQQLREVREAHWGRIAARLYLLERSLRGPKACKSTAR